ncbi:uncharacterized protein [Nicotiana sylvestris]|uniref:uncharacterized protein n=1 Tax=Nicotiana sylvestris TaxID=4096 RepID=UPI00388CBA4B
MVVFFFLYRRQVNVDESLLDGLGVPKFTASFSEALHLKNLNLDNLFLELVLVVLKVIILGRPWIHAVGAIPSTLHQMVKFEYEYQEIIVHGKDEQSIYWDLLVPCLEAREGSEHIVYQDFEVVVADQCEEGSPCPQPFLSNASIMVAKEMIRHGYKLGKGLGTSLQGITEPITLAASEKFFGVGFQATPTDETWANEQKNNGWVLPQLIPHLFETFVRPKYNEEKEDEAFTTEEIEEICRAVRQILYETHMVQPGEGSSTAEVLYMGPDAKLQNWKATQFPVRRESCSNNAALNNMTCLRTSCLDLNMLSHYEIMNQELEYDEEEAFREINRELEQFENKPKLNLNEIEPVNLGNLEEVQETMISIHTDERTRDVLIQLLFEFKDVFAWSYDDMPGLSVDLVVHKLPTYPNYPHVQQKQKKFKTDISDKIKEEVTKQLKAGVLMDEEDAKKTAFTTPWGTYCYRVMPFGLKNVGATYMRTMTAISPDMMHQTMKAQALADHLAENPVDDEYQPLNTYFHDEDVNSVEVISEDTNAWKMFFDGAVNAKGIGIGAILISPASQHYPATARLRFFYTNNTTEYESCIMGLNIAIDQDVEELLIMGGSDLIIQQAQGEWETRDVKIIPYRQHVEDLSKQFKSVEFRHGYCNTVEVEPDVRPWYHDIKRFLKTKEYPDQASGDQKRTIRQLASGFFLSDEVLYKKTPDLNLLRCVDAEEAGRIMYEVHAGVCGPHMNRYILAKKILRAGYYWMTMEKDCFSFVRKGHQYQVHGDLIHAPPIELHPMSAPWPFVAWGMMSLG